jgi:hypothetical protein
LVSACFEFAAPMVNSVFLDSPFTD